MLIVIVITCWRQIWYYEACTCRKSKELAVTKNQTQGLFPELPVLWLLNHNHQSPEVSGVSPGGSGKRCWIQFPLAFHLPLPLLCLISLFPAEQDVIGFTQGFLQLFAQGGWVGGGGAKWDCMDYWGSKYVHVSMCKACGKLWGRPGACSPGNVDFGPFIRHNLVESWTVFAQT